MNTSERPRTNTWRLVVCSIVVLAGVGGGLGTVQGQGTPDSTYYYGDAVSEDGSALPAGTVIKAVVDDGSGSNRTVDQVTMDTAGEYGGAGLGEDKLQIPDDVDGTVYFVAENDFGRFTAAETVQDPDTGTQRLDLTYPPGAAESRPYFDVSGLQPTEETVVDGNSIDVSATIDNTGSEQGTQTVTLDVDGQSLGTTEVTLGPGDQETVTFSLDTASLGPGDYTYAVASADDSQAGTLTVEAKRATFTVDGFAPADQTIVEGDIINASATVTNDGNAEGTQTVTLEAGGTTLASSDVTLAAGDEQAVEFSSISTDGLAPGSYTYGVYTDNESGTGTLTVEAERADMTVSELDPPDETLTVGAQFGVSATVTNDGNAEGTQTISFRIDGEQFGGESVTLSPDEEQTLSFNPVNTSELGPGTYSYEVASENDSQTGTLVVESDDPAVFTVVGLSPTNPTVTVGSTFDIETTVRNDGEQAATQRVEYRIDGTTVNRTAVTLASGEQTTVTFDGIQTGPPAPGTYTHGVYTNNDSQTGTLVIEGDDQSQAPQFTVSGLQPSSPSVTTDTAVDVRATITNTGGTLGSQRVQLRIDDETVDSTVATLGPGEQTTVTLGVDTGSLGVGTYVHSIATGNDSQEGTLEVTSQQDSTPTTGTPDGTPTDPTNRTVTPNATQQPTTTQSPTEDGGSGGGGLLPGGLVGTMVLWVALPLVVGYVILKGLALYLGY